MRQRSSDPSRPSAGVRAIVLYKSVKSGVQLALVVLAVALWPFGLPALLRQFALDLQQHATRVWAMSLATWLERGATDRGIELSLIAIAGDGTLTGIEAWALRRGRWWGPWLVVLATGSLLPFEVFELVRAPRWPRAVLLVANLAIVAYLARHAWRERLGRRACRAAPR
jgi:uncharacterized membrane protein (DUF2068 family)